MFEWELGGDVLAKPLAVSKTELETERNPELQVKIILGNFLRETIRRSALKYME